MSPWKIWVNDFHDFDYYCGRCGEGITRSREDNKMQLLEQYNKVEHLLNDIQVDKVYPCSIVEGVHPLYIR